MRAKATSANGDAEGRRRARGRVNAVRYEFAADLKRALAHPPSERPREVGMAVTQALGNIGTIRIDPFVDRAELEALTVKVKAAAEKARKSG